MKTQQTTHETNCLMAAASFSAVRGRGAQRIRKDFSTFAEAKEYAAEHGDGRTMIYAVTEAGSSAHIINA